MEFGLQSTIMAQAAAIQPATACRHCSALHACKQATVCTGPPHNNYISTLSRPAAFHFL